MKLIKRSFAAGEISPALNARTDLVQYANGAARLRNFFVDYRGGASTRPGTKFVGYTKFPNLNVTLIPFSFSVEQTYVLEFGNLYMRVLLDGGYVLEAEKAVEGVTNASPGVVTSTAHGFANGDWVYARDLAGIAGINGKYFVVAGATANTFELNDIAGAVVDTTSAGAWTSGGSFSRVYELATPYADEDVDLIKYTQSADVMTLVHPGYEPRDLSRTGHTTWTLDIIDFETSVSPPPLVSANSDAVGTGSTEYEYVVTAVSGDTGEESAISTPATVTTVAFGVEEFSIEVTWGSVGGGYTYNIYRAPWAPGRNVPGNPRYGLIGTTRGDSFVDANIGADYSSGPPEEKNPFFAANSYPGVVAYFQQRKAFARTNAKPNKLWFSQVGAFQNMNTSFPVKDSDAIIVTLNSQQVNEIKHLVAMPDGLIALTSGSAFQISGGGQTEAIAPANISAKQQSYTGASDIRPVVIGYDLFYVQSKGSTVRNISYNFFANVYTGADATSISSHLFYGYHLTSWAYAEEPHKVLWAVRDDGALLSLTFVKEQEVVGWAWHDTAGVFFKTCSITEGDEDAVYFIVKREVNGNWRYLVERLASRDLSGGLEEAWALDSALRSDLDYPDVGLRVPAASGTGVVFRSIDPYFDVGDVGSVIRVGGGRAVVTAFTDTTHVVCDIEKSITEVTNSGVPIPFDSGTWSIKAPFTAMSGFDHLEGQEVSVVADGVLQAPQTVVAGAITLDAPATRVIAGLPFVAQLQTLPIDSGDPTIQGYFKKLSRLTVRFKDSRGVWFGPTFDELLPMKEPTAELFTDDREVFMPAWWDTQGQLCLEARDPFPVTVLGIIPEVRVGKTPERRARASEDGDG